MQIITNQFQKEIKEHGNYSFPLLVSHEKLSKYEAGSFLWHWHPEIELTLITEGQMIYKVNNNIYHLCQGHALFGNSSTLHAGYMYQNQDCEYISITFEPKLIYGFENSIIYMKYIMPIIQNFSLPAVHFNLSEKWHEETIDIVNEIIRMEAEKYNTYELDILTKLDHFWKLLCFHNDNLPKGTPFHKYNYDRICNMISYIEENYASSLTLEDISETVHICKSECSRIFKKYMKVSLFEFILQYRIEKSIDYLINTNYSVIEIAETVGFNDSNYFSKAFRKQKGCSPTKYRNSIRLKHSSVANDYQNLDAPNTL